MDVTPNGDGDPNDENWTGIIDYKPLTFREAHYIYWMMKKASVSGNASFSASARNTGDYERITAKRQPDGSYVTTVADSMSGTASPSSSDYSDTLQFNSDYYGSQTEPVAPAKRMCKKGNFNKHYNMLENPNDSNTDAVTGNNAYGGIRASTGGSMGLYYYYGYYVNDRVSAHVQIPPANFFAMYDSGEFKGYGFKDLASFDIHVSASANCRQPVSSSLAPSLNAGVHMGGFGGISSIKYTDKNTMWEDTQISSSVDFGGFDFFAEGLGGNFDISNSGKSVTFSYSDSDSDSGTYDVNTIDSTTGAGITYSGDGECEVEASFDITFEAPKYWDYPT
jgi:hypothetical protein